MLTIFTSCCPFVGEKKLIQKNAIESWLRLDPPPEILVMGGREEGIKEYIGSLQNLTSGQSIHTQPDIRLVDIEYTDYGLIPTNVMYKTAQKEAKNDMLCYSDSDLIHFQCLMEVAKNLKRSKFKEYVATGQRHNLNIDFEIENNLNSDSKLLDLVETKGVLESPSGCSYFVFPRGMDWAHMPGFDLGRTNVDTWINADVIERGIPLVNATDDIVTIHQEHAHDSGNWEEQNRRNIELAGDKSLGCDVATYILHDGRIYCLFLYQKYVKGGGDIRQQQPQQQPAPSVQVI